MVYSPERKRISLLLKLIVVTAAAIGVIRSANAGSSSFMGGIHVFMFFTIQSNVAIALICAYGALRLLQNRSLSDLYYLIQFVGTVSITLTGVVFCFVLAPTLGRFAWALNNVLTHVVVPAAAVLDFFVSGIYGNVTVKDLPYVTLPPLAYAVYAGIGYLAGWEFLDGIHYPYFFLNWGSPAGAFGFSKELPFMGCVWWILLLLLFLIGVGWLYLVILERLKQHAGIRPPAAEKS